MSAVNSARASARRTVAASGGMAFENDAEFRLNLSDIPHLRESMDIDGLKPSLLSRLLDLVAPLKP